MSAYLATGAVISAVNSTPTVASMIEGARTVSDALEFRLQAAVEQDQRQRHRPHQIGGPDIVERDAAGAGLAGENPNARKTSSNGAPKRSAIRLDRMPAITRTAPRRMAMLKESRDAIVRLKYVQKHQSKYLYFHPYRRVAATPTHFCRHHKKGRIC